MAKAKDAAKHELELLLARSLFRSDKWDPARDSATPFEWDGVRTEYLKKSKRMLRILEKDGLAMSIDAVRTE